MNNPVGKRPEMNIFCTFKIGSFVPIKKERLLDVLKVIFVFHLNAFQLQFQLMRKIVICLFSEKHFNFMIWNFMTLIVGMQNRWILFVRDFKIFVPSWKETGLLIKLRGINHYRVWKKKISVKNLEKAKPSHSDQGRNWQQRGRERWWVA